MVVALEIWKRVLVIVGYTALDRHCCACTTDLHTNRVSVLLLSCLFTVVWLLLTKISDNPENGPSFGADSLVIPLGKANPRMARSKLGSYYERFSDGSNSLFNNGASVTLKDLKVYHGVYEEGEYIPFTDAEPFALY